MRRLAEEEGTVAAFVAVLAIAIVAVAGLAYDGGAIITAHAAARDLAGAAARAGAQHVAIEHVHAGQPALDAHAAHERAAEVLAEAGAQGTVTVEGATVTVTVTDQQPMRILPLAARPITATASATAISDVLDDEEGPL